MEKIRELTLADANVTMRTTKVPKNVPIEPSANAHPSTEDGAEKPKRQRPAGIQCIE